MPLVYLDANALLRWAEGQAAPPTPDQEAASYRVEEIILDDRNAVAISEMTFIEFHDNVLRYQVSGAREWTDDWVHAVQTQVMEWLETGRVSVRPPGPRALDVAMSYISMTREVGRSLKAADAIHLTSAIEWAHETGERVTLVTGDRGFEKFLEVFPTAAQFIALEKINVTQKQMPGTAA